MEAGHVPLRPAARLASAWRALCRVPATGPWVWLARSCPLEATPAIALVLLDGLPGLLVAAGKEGLGHG